MKKVLVLAAMALAVSSVAMAQEGEKSCCKKGSKKECSNKSSSKDKKGTETATKTAKPVATPAPSTGK